MSLKKRLMNILFGESNIEMLKHEWRKAHEDDTLQDTDMVEQDDREN